MLARINQLFSMRNLLIFYWIIFWLMNGLDKFLNRTDVRLFVWHGKDRSEQFGNYFSNCALAREWIKPLLYAVGVWELLLCIPLLIVLKQQVFQSRLEREWFKLGMFWGGATFVGFAFFDVIIGDRAELLEHSTFLILIAVSYHVILSRRAK